MTPTLNYTLAGQESFKFNCAEIEPKLDFTFAGQQGELKLNWAALGIKLDFTFAGQVTEPVPPQPITLQNQDCDVVIVGGGPAGMWVADQLKLRNRNLNVVVLEKRNHYVRTHPVRIHPHSLSGTPYHPRLNEIKKIFTERQSCKINTVEEELKKFAIELGIDVRTQEVKIPSQLPQIFPNAKVFIGADGAHSKVRQEIFNDELSFDQSLQQIIEVRYDVSGTTSKLGLIENSLSMQKTIGTLTNENVSSEVNGKSTVTLQFFVGKETYEAMREANFRNPYTFADHQHLIPPQLTTKINAWIAKRRDRLGEQIIENSVRIAAVPLKIYSAKTLVKEGAKPGTTWALIGDAAFGIPFFRSLNTSFLSGTELASAVAASQDASPYWSNKVLTSLHRWVAGESIDGNVPPSFAPFAAYTRLLSRVEAFGARVKAFGITFFRGVLSGPSAAFGSHFA